MEDQPTAVLSQNTAQSRGERLHNVIITISAMCYFTTWKVLENEGKINRPKQLPPAVLYDRLNIM